MASQSVWTRTGKFHDSFPEKTEMNQLFLPGPSLIALPRIPAPQYFSYWKNPVSKKLTFPLSAFIEMPNQIPFKAPHRY